MAACGGASHDAGSPEASAVMQGPAAPASDVPLPPPVSQPTRRSVTGTAALILEGLRVQCREAAVYTVGYVGIPYPGGDVPRSGGVCTDVVIRALRAAGHDLQKLVHEDMASAFGSYPTRWGLKKPDPNIDHRRIPNQRTFFARHGAEIPLDAPGEPSKVWLPGHIVYWKLPDGLDHCGVVSDGLTEDGTPLVVHNYGVCGEEDALFAWKIVGHAAWPPPSS